MILKTKLTEKDKQFISALEVSLNNAVEEGNRFFIQEAPREILRKFHLRRKRAFVEAGLSSEFPLVQGCAMTAKYYRHGDPLCIQSAEYGGLGLVASSGFKRLAFGKNQLWFSSISGRAFEKASFAGNAGWYAETKGDSLSGAYCEDNSLWYSVNSGNALRGSTNHGFALVRSINRENALSRSQNYSYALSESCNAEDSLAYSHNHGHALERSVNKNRALRFSYNIAYALRGSTNHDLVLWYAKIRNHALTASRNDTETLRTGDSKSWNKESRFFWKNREDMPAEEYCRERTCEEVGKMLGVSRVRINQIERNALDAIRQKLRKQFVAEGFFISDAELANAIQEHIEKLNEDIPYYRVLPSFEEVHRNMRWITQRKAYSTDIRSLDNIGAWAQQSRFYWYLRSGYTSRIMWGVRNGLFPIEY